jgi:hypothetical protein
MAICQQKPAQFFLDITKAAFKYILPSVICDANKSLIFKISNKFQH